MVVSFRLRDGSAVLFFGVRFEVFSRPWETGALARFYFEQFKTSGVAAIGCESSHAKNFNGSFRFHVSFLPKIASFASLSCYPPNAVRWA